MTELRVSRGLAYVANGAHGLVVIDVSDPTSPTPAGFYRTPSYAEDVFVADGLVYVAARTAGLLILRYNRPVVSARKSWMLYE